jgi:hypothetical protein
MKTGKLTNLPLLKTTAGKSTSLTKRKEELTAIQLVG